MINVLDQKTDSRHAVNVIDAQIRQRAQGAYLGLAIGDALGATVEFLTPQEIRHQYGVHRDIVGGGWLKLACGQVTDDTTMTFALAESILRSGGIHAQVIAEGFSNWMRHKPVDIGNTVRRGIVHYRTSGDTCMPENEYDAGNGACMRSLAIALATFWSHEDDALRASRVQAHITHNNRASDAGSECLIRMLRSILMGSDKSTLVNEIIDDFVDNYPQFSYQTRKIANPSAYIVDTMQVILQCFFNHNSFESILLDVVNRGGDADTTGAIAGMLAGAYYCSDGIPDRWIEALDEDVRQKCIQQADALLQLSLESHLTENYIA